MFALFILLGSLAVFVGGIVLFSNTKSRADQDAFASISIVGLIVFFMALLLFCHTFVPTNHAGIINTFGKNNPHRYYAAGFNLKWPWEKIQHVDLSYSDFAFVSNEDGAYDVISALTKDNVVIVVPLSYTWAINPARVAEVKSLRPQDGVYSLALYHVTRSAVRDVISQMTLGEALENRSALAKKLSDAMIEGNARYYAAQGYRDPGSIVRFGLLTLRGVYPPQNVTDANAALLSAQTEAQVAAERTRVPSDRSVGDYVAVQEAQTARAAVDKGNPVTIVMGDAQAVAVAGGRR